MNQITFHNDDILPAVIRCLTEATTSIHLSLGWMNDKGLNGLLQKKALEGVDVRILLVRESNSTVARSDFKQVTPDGVQIIYLDDSRKEQFIDHRFGLIDGEIILTGNYSWGHNIRPQEPTLTIIDSVPSLAIGYISEFEFLSISNDLSKDEPKPHNPIYDLIKKLSVIKILLSIGDTENIDLRIADLDDGYTDGNVLKVRKSLMNEDYDEALELLEPLIDIHRSLLDCIDPPIKKFQREIRLLEDEIAEISNEYNDTQKTLHRFSKEHSEHLGDLLQKILLQNKIKAEIEAIQDEDKMEDYEEAKNDHEEYSKSYELSKKDKFKKLSPSEQKELKKLYRKTSLKCHPDRVIDEFHDQAEELFVQLNQAYKANDLDGVKQISNQLKEGIMLAKSEGISELKKLERTVNNLNQKLDDWLSKLDELKAMPTYQTISNIEDWSTYFLDTKEVLVSQLDRLLLYNTKYQLTPQEEESEPQ